jgi:hypothetical protein
MAPSQWRRSTGSRVASGLSAFATRCGVTEPAGAKAFLFDATSFGSGEGRSLLDAIKLDRLRGRQSRQVCPDCGSAVMITLDRYPEIRSMMGGTLDDKTRIKPAFSLWCASAQPWLQLPSGIELFADYPDGLIA